MAETLEEEMDRQAPRVNAELARRDAVKKADTGITMRYGAFFEDGNHANHGPMFESVPGVWTHRGSGMAWHANGIVLHSAVDDPRNLKTEIQA